MQPVTEFFALEPKSIVTAAVVILTAIFAFKAITLLFDWIVERFGIRTESSIKKQNEHELLVATVSGLKELNERHSKDVENSLKNEENLKKELIAFSQEVRESLKQTQEQMQQYADNRIHDREQSFAIQKELTDSIKIISDSGTERDKQIKNLMIGSMELLGDKIDQRFSRYVALGGIPENELDEFTGIFRAYEACGGNHKRKDKYEYVMNNMKIIPVTAKLMLNDKESQDIKEDGED